MIILSWHPGPSPAVRAIDWASRRLQIRAIVNARRYHPPVFSVFVERGSGWKVDEHPLGDYGGRRGAAIDRAMAAWSARGRPFRPIRLVGAVEFKNPPLAPKAGAK